MTKLSYNRFPLYKVDRPYDGVLHVTFDRPRSRNAVNTESWRQFRGIFDQAEFDPEVRVIVISGEGKAFCAGLDVKGLAHDFAKWEGLDGSRLGIQQTYFIREFQHAIARPYTVNKPVIAVGHGACIGLAIDIMSACDIRYASTDSVFSIREVEIGMAADVGTLQRMPKLCNNLGWLKEAAYTARNFGAEEAQQQGFVDKVFESKEIAVDRALTLAKLISEKSPVAIHGTKKSINYAIDHTHTDGLEQIAEFNGHGLDPDLKQGAAAAMSKQKPKYAKL